jgi:hypothetical protein
MLKDLELDRISHIQHGFFTRNNGASGGIYNSLNVGIGSDDDADAVATNRERAMARLGLGADALVTIYQVHGADVHVVDQGNTAKAPVRADGMVTRAKGIALGILTADCAPVLFADKDNDVIGAAHAGWRGAQGGVLEATIAAMETLGAERASVVAAIGPCIGGMSYEVGPEFPAPFLADNADHDRFFVPSPLPRWGATPAPTKTGFSAIGARPTGVRRITAVCSRRLRLRNNSDASFDHLCRRAVTGIAGNLCFMIGANLM